MGFAASIEEIPAVFELVRRGKFDGARDFCAELDRLPEQIGAGKAFPPGG